MPKALQIKEFDPDIPRPPFIPFDLDALEGTAKGTALSTLQSTINTRKRFNPLWDQALQAGQKAILGDVKGDSTLIPQIQAEAMRAGIGDSLDAFGDVGSTLTPGSAGAAKVSTNLFGTANALNQQMRDNRYRALKVGSELFPDTQIGLSGQDAAVISGANTVGRNSWNESSYRDALENARLNWRVQNENLRAQATQANTDSAADAQKSAANKQALIQGGAAIAGVAVLAIAL